MKKKLILVAPIFCDLQTFNHKLYESCIGTIAYNIERLLLIAERLLCNIPEQGYYSFYKSEDQRKILEKLSIKKLKKASPPQPSVLHRDLYPFIDLVFKTVLNAVQTLDSAFDKSSCNPFFGKRMWRSLLIVIHRF